jgi:aerobic carbon-monoxide dehydrogenase medium subunit
LRSDLLKRHFVALTETAEDLGDQQVRNRGSLGGSLAHSDPAGDMPAVVLALKAEIVVQDPKSLFGNLSEAASIQGQNLVSE